jgi:hypothetical protein
MSSAPDPAIADLCDTITRLTAENEQLRQEAAELRESTETAVFVANQMGEDYRTERDRREDAHLRWDVTLNELAAERAKVQAVRDLITRLRASTPNRDWVYADAVLDALEDGAAIGDGDDT